MILVLLDAGNVSSGGGVVLLDYLIDEFVKYEINIFLIKNPSYFHNKINSENSTKLSSVIERKKVYKQILREHKVTSIFAFGNYPPPLYLKMPVYTYMHNPYLVEDSLSNLVFDKLLALRKLYLRMFIKNTTSFLFQTNMISNSFIQMYHYNKKNCKILPFFNEAIIAGSNKDRIKKKRFIYPSLPHPHKNHHRLLAAWELLVEQGVYPELILTIPFDNYVLIEKIDQINNKGAKITNLGWIPSAQIYKQIADSEFCIFPSLKETLGLSLVEAAILETRVLVNSKLDLSEIIIPSITFDAYCSFSIVEAVSVALNDELPPTIKIMNNRIDEIISLFNFH